MHWADKYAEEIIKKKDKERYVVEAGITPSGVVHAGNFREIMSQELVHRALLSRGVKARFQYVWDDFDRFRKVPKGVNKEFEQYIGMPISKVPDPWGCHDSYAEHFKASIMEESQVCGVDPEYISMAEQYGKCAFAEEVKTALENAAKVRGILNEFRKEDHPEDWLPVRVYCEKCWKDTTKVKYEGGYEVSYACECGNEGKFDFRKTGNIKLTWRTCWGMRWAHYDVDFESSGKDHKAAGGSWDTSTKICEEVYGHDAPIGPMYEFIYAKGQSEKMSSSEGNVFTVSDLLEIYEPEMVRFIYTRKMSKAIEVPFDMDVLNSYNYYDEAETEFFDKKADENEMRKYELSQIHGLKQTVQPPFAYCVTLVQAAPGREKEVMQKTGHLPAELSKEDEEKLALRLKLAKNWIEKYAPESVKVVIQKKLPQVELSNEQEEFLKKLSEADFDNFEEGFKGALGDLPLKQGFEAAYKVLLGKPRGPRLAMFVQSLDEDFVRNRFALKE